jgi:hypothetical protein
MGNDSLITQKKVISPNNNNDLAKVKNFMESNPNGCLNFRYYLNRDISVIKNHIFTCLYYNNENIIGYGHLDYEDGKIWLGIIISDDSKSKGFGGLIMDDLLSKTQEPIYLSVDKDNKIAQRLYKNKKFFIFKENNKNIIMVRKMADTLGTLVDKLTTVDLKMWNNQELLYEIRRMSFDEYKEKYFNSEDGANKLWNVLKKACDLNVQRNQLINEVDEKILEIINAKLSGEDLDNGKFLQRSHKTY